MSFSTTQYKPLTSLASDGELESWLARATQPDGEQFLVVIQRIPRAVSDDGPLLRAAYQETQRAASLGHRGLIAARDLFEREDGYYVAIDFTPGETLQFLWQAYANAQTPAPLALTARVIAEAAAALDFARRKTSSAGDPLIHGHLSPKTLLLGYDGKTRIVGHGTWAIHHGVAKARGGLGGSNLHYCAPEQFKGGEVDARTDMFALGVILWELLTGRRLYDRGGPYEVMRAVCDEAVPKPSNVESSVPSRLDPIIQRALAKSPARRFSDYGEFLTALESILQLPGVADQSMRLGSLLQERFPDRASKWQAVEEAERSGDFERASYLVRELEQASGHAAPKASTDDVTVTDIVPDLSNSSKASGSGSSGPSHDAISEGARNHLADSLGDLGDDLVDQIMSASSALDDADESPTRERDFGSDDETQPRDALQYDFSGDAPDETTQVTVEADAFERLDPEDTLLTEAPKEVWEDTAESTKELERRSTEVDAAGTASQTSEQNTPNDVSGRSALVDDPTLPLREKLQKAKRRRGTALGKPLAPEVDEAKEVEETAEQDPPIPRSPFFGEFSDVEEDSEPIDEPEPEYRQPEPGNRQPEPTPEQHRGPVRPSVSLGAGFDELDWSEAFAQFDEDEDDYEEDYEAPFAIDEILEPPKAKLPSHDDRASHVVMEIVRHADGRALAVDKLEGLKRRYRDKEAPFSANLGMKTGSVSIGQDVDGWVRRKNDGENRRELPPKGEKLELKPGDQCELRKDQVAYRVRVMHPPLPPMRNRPQVTKQKIVVYLIALLLAGAAHGGGLLGVMAVQALGVRMTVDEKPKQEEIFAEGELEDVKKPEEEPKKPEPKPPAPTKPKPKPVDPTEQKVKIPKTIKKQLSKRVKEKVASRSSGSASDTQNTLEMLKSPNPGSGSSVKEVVSNIDAVKKPNGSGGFKVGGTISSLEGNKVNMALGGGGKLGKLGGKKVGSDVGKLDKRKKSGKVRGKVSGIKALAKVQGSLSRSDVYKTIGRYQGQLQGCYERRLIDNPSISGKITFEWVIKTNGRVRNVRQRSSTVGDAKVSSCVKRVIKKMKFPRPKGGEVEISYPFVFRQG